MDLGIKKKSCIQGIKHNIPQIFQIIHCVISDVSWKCHENPLVHFSIMLLTDKMLCLVWGLWNNLVRHETVQLNVLLGCVRHILTI